jgi:hypothetical protein
MKRRKYLKDKINEVATKSGKNYMYINVYIYTYSRILIYDWLLT